MKNLLTISILFLMSCGAQKALLDTASQADLVAELDKDSPGYIKKEGNKREEDSLAVEWPKKDPTYQSNTMGHELNKIFGSYTKLTQLSDNENRDYIPKIIKDFIKDDRLNVSTERANISGRGVFFYIYKDVERKGNFSSINFEANTTRKLKLKISNISNYDIDEDIDNFMLTRTARGMIDAFIEGGIKPPYSSIEVAAQKEKEQNSALFILSGSFESPILTNFKTNTEILLGLWDIYSNNEELIEDAYYLKSFNGAISRFTTSKKEYQKLAGNGALNFNGPMDLNLKAGLSAERESSSFFKGTDWETIINVNNISQSDREGLFLECPSPTDIKDHFREISAIPIGNRILVKEVDDDQLIEFFVPSIPQSFHDGNNWEIESFTQNTFNGTPRLEVTPHELNGKQGLKYTFKVKPLTTIFGDDNENDANLPISFVIKSTKTLTEDQNIVVLKNTMKQIMTLNKDPKISFPEQVGYAQLSPEGVIVNSPEKNIKWTIKVEVDRDDNNPVLFQSGVSPRLINKSAKLNGSEINLNHTVDIVGGTEKAYVITLKYEDRRFDFRKIDWENNEVVNFSADLMMPLKSNGEAKRNINVVLSFPVEIDGEDGL